MAPKKVRPRWSGEPEKLVDSLRDMAYKYRHKTPTFPAPGKSDKETLVKHCATMHSLLQLQPTLAFKRASVRAAWETLLQEVAQWQDAEWVDGATDTVMKMCRSLEQKMIHGDSRSPFLKLMGLTNQDEQPDQSKQTRDDEDKDDAQASTKQQQQQQDKVATAVASSENTQVDRDDDADDEVKDQQQNEKSKAKLGSAGVAASSGSHYDFQTQPSEEAQFDWGTAKGISLQPDGRETLC